MANKTLEFTVDETKQLITELYAILDTTVNVKVLSNYNDDLTFVVEFINETTDKIDIGI